jgi:hypothetical protein
VAAARRAGQATLVLGTAVLLAAAMVRATIAADPSPSPPPTPQAPTCAERYPADGPAGVDLLLGCVVSELVRYAGGLGGGLEPVGEPPRLSQYLVPIAIIVTAIVAVVLVVRVARRDAGRRLAPAAPVAWWSCPACRSLNAAGRRKCYRCGHAVEVSATELRVDAEPLAPQSFGRRIDVETSDRPPEPPEPPPDPQA